MTIPHRERERRDWTLIIFLIPLGIIFIIIVGQLAIRMFPNWSVNANMRSNLDPNSAPGQPASLLQPLLPQILTQMAWADSYLTPSGDSVFFPPFIVLEPTSTPTRTPVPPTPTSTTITPTATTPSPTTTFTATSTLKPTDDSTPTATSTSTSTSTATSTGTPTSTATSTATSTSTTTPTGYPSTPDPSWTQVSVPPQIGSTPGPPDNTPPGSYTGLGSISQNTYIVVNFSVVVQPTPDANYDLVLYEFNNYGYVYLDWVIVGISNDANGATYYEVFNWGNGIPDMNTNVGDVAGAEADEQITPLSEFYDPDGGSNDNQTGILIDVDTATSQPPPGTYNYIVIIAPNGGGPTEIDSVDVTEVPLPSPTP